MWVSSCLNIKSCKQAKYSKRIDPDSQALSEACRPDNNDVTRGSSSLPVYQRLPYRNIQDHVSAWVCVCVQLKYNNERLTWRQTSYDNVQKIEFSSTDRRTETADWLRDLSYLHTLALMERQYVPPGTNSHVSQLCACVRVRLCHTSVQVNTVKRRVIFSLSPGGLTLGKWQHINC